MNKLVKQKKNILTSSKWQLYWKCPSETFSHQSNSNVAHLLKLISDYNVLNQKHFELGMCHKCHSTTKRVSTWWWGWGWEILALFTKDETFNHETSSFFFCGVAVSIISLIFVLWNQNTIKWVPAGHSRCWQ